ncbi:hypothetical protein [Ferrimonas senticii]|uniref:hypothetical protein n=1 Tax=Ferrimonas senticii TaxID=394566 RepID=UPI00041438E8|nr:hypothetical protein [Ferrimonas senticii]
MLLGFDAFDAVMAALHGSWLTESGDGYVAIVYVAIALVALLTLVHVLAAARKFPWRWQQCAALYRHSRIIHHPGTRLWLVQLLSGIGLLVLVAQHLIVVTLDAATLSGQQSAHAMAHLGGWWFYALLLPCSIVHAMAGITRLWLKWCPISEPRFLGRSLTKWFALYLLLLGSASVGYSTYLGINL